MKFFCSIEGYFTLFLTFAFASTFLLYSTACTKQAPNTRNTMQVAGLVTDSTEVLRTWPGHRAILEKYKSMLPPENEDRLLLDDIIVTGNSAYDRLEAILNGGPTPTVNETVTLFLSADAAVMSGKILFDKYQAYISPGDQYRAKLFSENWNRIKGNVFRLNKGASVDSRSTIASEILTTSLQVAGRVAIPTLQSTGEQI